MTYFAYDMEGGLEEFPTLSKALEWAKDCIAGYRDEEWYDGVGGVVVGKITHRAMSTNIVTPDMLDEDSSYGGKFYTGTDISEWCDYVMMPTEEPSE